MGRNKTLVFIIILLLITNISLLGYLFVYGKKHKNDKEKDGFTFDLKKKVGFSDDQLQQFDQLKRTHWAKAVEGLDNIVRVKLAIFELNKQGNVPDSAVAVLADSIGKLRSEAEMNIYYHTKETRALCTSGQKPAYDSLITALIYKQGKNVKPPPRRKD